MDARYFLIGTDGRHYGPLSQDDVRTWLADGRASRYSRARRETEDQWAALRDMPEFEEETRPPYVGSASAERSPEAESTVVVDRSATRITGRIDPIGCFRRAWLILAADFAVLAGWTVLIAIIISGLTLIPRVGIAIGAVVNNLLMCGLYVLFLSRMRGLRPSFADVSAIVRTSAVRIILAGIIQSLLTAPLVIAGLSKSPAALGALFVLFLPCIYLLVGYVFVLPLIVDRQMPVWTAMELSRRTVQRTWFSAFGLLLAAGLLLWASTLLFGFLLVITLPLCTATLMVAYEDLFSVEQ